MQHANMCHLWRGVYTRASALSHLSKVRPARSGRTIRARLGNLLASERLCRLVGIGFGSAATAVCVGLVLKDLIK